MRCVGVNLQEAPAEHQVDSARNSRPLFDTVWSVATDATHVGVNSLEATAVRVHNEGMLQRNTSYEPTLYMLTAWLDIVWSVAYWDVAGLSRASHNLCLLA